MITHTYGASFTRVNVDPIPLTFNDIAIHDLTGWNVFSQARNIDNDKKSFDFEVEKIDEVGGLIKVSAMNTNAWAVGTYNFDILFIHVETGLRITTTLEQIEVVTGATRHA